MHKPLIMKRYKFINKKTNQVAIIETTDDSADCCPIGYQIFTITKI